MGIAAHSSSSFAPTKTAGIADEATIVAHATRDPRAFAPLYEQFVEPVYNYCYRRLGSRETAEDATSLIFERVLNALPGYRGGCFRAWLFTIAHNVITDSYRSGRIHEPLDAAEDLPDPALQPDALVVLADQQRLLLALLPLLPVEQRRVMELRLSGLPSTEVAAILGRTPESVRTLQRRAILRLQALLAVPTMTREASNG